MECWFKSAIDLIFKLYPLVMRGPNRVYIFRLYQPLINPSFQAPAPAPRQVVIRTPLDQVPVLY